MHLEKARILIVDDEPQNTTIIRNILDYNREYVIEVAENGEAALEKLQVFCPDIVLLDIMMPGMDGYEVCRRIRKAKEHRFVKVIMVSGLAFIEERLKGYEAGADDYITKPFVDEELLAKIGVFSKLSRVEEVEMLKSTALHLITHETRTPLNGIMLGCEFLGEIGGLSAEAREYVDIIASSSARMYALINKINLFCQLKSGAELIFSEKELSSELTNCVGKFIVQYPDIKIDIKVPSSLMLRADWSLLEKAIDFVMDNAFRFSSSPGKVEIDVEQKKDEVQIRIGDTGPGLNRLTMERIFSGLYADNILHHHRGTGLSLSICRLIMEHHRGSVTCRSKKVRGSEFTLSLPL